MKSRECVALKENDRMTTLPKRDGSGRASRTAARNSEIKVIDALVIVIELLRHDFEKLARRQAAQAAICSCSSQSVAAVLTASLLSAF